MIVLAFSDILFNSVAINDEETDHTGVVPDMIRRTDNRTLHYNMKGKKALYSFS